MGKNIRKHILQATLLLALTAFALWFALKDDYQDVMKTITNVSISGLVLILILGILYYVIQGYVLYMIAKPYKEDIRIRDGMHNSYIAAFFNGVTPLGGGQVAQTYALRRIGMEYKDIASVLWKDFFLYQSTVVVYVAVLFLMKFGYAFEKFHAYILLVIVGFCINSSVILILWTMSRFPKLYVRISSGIVSILYKVHLIKNKEKMLEKWQGQILYFNEEIKKLKEDKLLIVKAVALNFIRQTIFYVLPFVVAKALHIPMSNEDILNVILMSSFIHMLNALTPLPGDTGFTESAFILIFAVIFGRIEASSVMILWRMATYHVNILIGGIVFLYVKSTKKIPPKNKVKEKTYPQRKMALKLESYY